MRKRLEIKRCDEYSSEVIEMYTTHHNTLRVEVLVEEYNADEGLPDEVVYQGFMDNYFELDRDTAKELVSALQEYLREA